MTGAIACIEEPLIDGHFGRGLSLDEEVRLRTHVPGCSACRDRYARLSLLARLDPTSPAPIERLGGPLGLSGSKRPRRKLRLIAAAGALGLAAAVLLAAPRLFKPPEEMAFRARGGGAEVDALRPLPHLRVFKVARGTEARPQPVAHSVRRGDDLAFAYESPGARSHLMIFGVDEAKRVYWYHPAWTSAALDPASLRIEPSGLRTLPEAISHDLAGKSLSIYAVFSDVPLHVSEIERSVAAGESLPKAFAIAGAVVESESFAVEP